MQQGITSKSGVNTNNSDTILEDKLQWYRAQHAKWSFENKKKVIDRAELMFWQKTRYKDVGSIIFGYALCERQVDAI